MIPRLFAGKTDVIALNTSRCAAAGPSSRRSRRTTACRRQRAGWEVLGRRVGRSPAAPDAERWADEGSVALLPESGAAFHMSDSQDHDFIMFQAVDDVIGEARHQHAAAVGVFVRGRSDQVV